MALLKDAIGIERLLFGSDFPHTEGLPDPMHYVKDIPEFDAAETKAIMRDNVLELLGPHPPRTIVSIAIGEDHARAARGRPPVRRGPLPAGGGPAAVDGGRCRRCRRSGTSWRGLGLAGSRGARAVRRRGLRLLGAGRGARGAGPRGRPRARAADRVGQRPRAEAGADGEAVDARSPRWPPVAPWAPWASPSGLSRQRGRWRRGRSARCSAGRWPTCSSSRSTSAAREQWCLVQGADADVAPIESLDPTRPPGRAHASPTARRSPCRTLTRAQRRGHRRRAGGGRGRRAVAAWCVDTAADLRQGPAAVRAADRPVPGGEAPVRRHARAPRAGPGAWRGTPRPRSTATTRRAAEAALATAAAGAIALDALRRRWPRTASRCSAGSASPGSTTPTSTSVGPSRCASCSAAPRRWRREVAAAALGGTRRHLTLDLPAEAEALRAEVARRRRRDRRPAEGRSAGPRWPRPGCSCPTGRRPGAATPAPVEQLVIDQELRRGTVRVPAPPGGRVGGARRSRPTALPSSRSGGSDRRSRGEIVLVPALQRAGGRLRPRRADHHRHPSRGRLAAQRAEGVDHDGPGGRLGHLPGPHQPRRAQAPRASPTSSSTCDAGHRHPTAAGADRAGDVQRGVPRRRLRARRLRDRRGRRRLAAGPHHAGQRAGVDGQRVVVRRRHRGADRAGGRAPSTTGGSTGRPAACSTSSGRWSPRRTRSR